MNYICRCLIAILLLPAMIVGVVVVMLFVVIFGIVCGIAWISRVYDLDDEWCKKSTDQLSKEGKMIFENNKELN